MVTVSTSISATLVGKLRKYMQEVAYALEEYEEDLGIRKCMTIYIYIERK